MATYTQGVDPNSFQTSGYQLPTSQIIQAVATRNAYWDAGASALKNAYNRNLNLNLTLEQNKSELQGLMKGVDMGLKKAVQSDLSIQPNVADAMKIFDPVVRNENIQGDHAITSHYQKEMQLADTYRTKDGGKEYSPTNVRDLMIGLDRFAKSGDPSKWREHYAQRRSYTPYYDVQSEINALRKTFKPTQTKTSQPSIDPKTGEPAGFYMVTNTDRSSYENQWKAYLSANLSDKARTQLAINGRVAYYGNEGALVNDYSDYTSNKITSTVKQRDLVKGILKALPEGELKGVYTEQMNELEDNIKELQGQKKKLDAGDTSVIAQDQDAIASLVYSDNYISNLARSLETRDVEVLHTVDSAAVNYYNQQIGESQFARSLDLKRDIAEANLAFKYSELAAKDADKKKEEELQWNSATMTSTEVDDKTLNKQLYDNQVKESKTNLDVALKGFDQYLNAMGVDTAGMNDTTRESFLKTWLATPGNKESRAYQAYKQAHDIYNNQRVVRDQIVAEGTAAAKQRYPELFRDKTKVLDNNSFTVQDGGKEKKINISDDDIRAAYLGTSSKLKITPDPAGGFNNISYTDNEGKTYELPTWEATRITNGVDVVRGRYGAAGDKVREMIEQKITQSFSIQKPDGDQFKNPAMVRARQGFVREYGLSSDALKEITVYGRNQFGMYYNVPSSLDDEKLGVSRKALIDRVEHSGGKQVQVGTQSFLFVPYFVQSGGGQDPYLNPQLRPIQGYFDQHKATSDNTTVKAPDAINYDPNNIGEAFSFLMVNLGGVPTYYPVHKNSKKQITPTPAGFESLEAADVFLRGAFRNKADFDQKIKYYR